MRILNLISSLSGGGAERQLSYIAPSLAAKGHDVHVAYFWAGPEIVSDDTVRYHLVKVDNNYDINGLVKIRKLILELRPDIIQTWLPQMDILMGLYSLTCPIIWVTREASSAKAYTAFSFKKILRAKLMSRATGIIANSKGGAAYWKAQKIRVPCYIIPNALPLNEIEKVSAYQSSHLLNERVPTILFVGRMVRSKRADALIRGLHEVNNYTRVDAIFAGDGPERSNLEVLVDDLGLRKQIQFIGHQSRSMVWSLMKNATAIVSLSEFEGCPNSVMEACACGCALLLSDIASHREIVDEESALFVKSIALKEISDGLRSIISDRSDKQMRLMSVRKRMGFCTFDGIATCFEDTYNTMLGGSKT